MLFYGLGLGIPFINTVTMIVAYRRLGATGTTLWDEQADAVVTIRAVSVINAIGVLVFCAVLVRAAWG